jgi:glyoxylase I family protein
MRANDDQPMTIEHLGLNVSEPCAAANWYVTHLGMRVARESGPPHHAHFLVDASGRMMLEIYNNPDAPLPDYRTMHPLMLHLAFAVEDVPGERVRLLDAGASDEGGVDITPAGDRIAMLRDPWGLPLQLVQRARPLV